MTYTKTQYAARQGRGCCFMILLRLFELDFLTIIIGKKTKQNTAAAEQ